MLYSASRPCLLSIVLSLSLFVTSVAKSADDSGLNSCFSALNTDHANAHQVCQPFLNRPDEEISINNKTRIIIGFATFEIMKGQYLQAESLLDDIYQRNEYLHNDNIYRYNWLRTKAMVFFQQSMFAEALPVFKQAHRTALNINMEIQIATTSNDIASTLMELGSYYDAMQYYKKSIDIFLKLGIQHSLALSYSGIALAYSDMGDTLTAIAFLEKAITAHLNHQEEYPDFEFSYFSLAQARKELAQVYIAEGELEQALPLLAMAEKYMKNAKNIPELVKIIVLRSELALAQDKPNLALQIVTEARDLEVESTDSALPEVYQMLAKSYSSVGRINDALNAARMGLDIALEGQHFVSELFFLKWLGEYYSSHDEPENAMHYFERYTRRYEQFLQEKYNPSINDVRSMILVNDKLLELKTLQSDKVLAKQTILQRTLIAVIAVALAVLFATIALFLRIQNRRKSALLQKEISMHKQALVQLSRFGNNDEDQELGQQSDNEVKDFRQLLVKLMCLSCDLWEQSTGTGRIDLAEKSRIWSIIVDDGRLRTRTMDRYLKLESLPQKPRWQHVIRTCRFVLIECKMSEECREKLNDLLQQTLSAR